MAEFNITNKSYFGSASCGNGRLLERLESGGRSWPENIEQAREWMNARRKKKAAKEALKASAG